MKLAKFGHVQRQPGRVEPERGDHAAGKPGLDLAQHRGSYRGPA
jgi:hypothetical protein